MRAVSVLLLAAVVAISARPLPKHALRHSKLHAPVMQRPAGPVKQPAFGPLSAGDVCDPTRRTDCGYVGINQQQCQQKGCCWQPTTTAAAAVDADDKVQAPGDIPWCFYQVAPLPVYSVTSSVTTPNGMSFVLTASDTSAGAISPLQADVTFETVDRCHIKVHDPNAQRWEIPQDVLPSPAAPNTAPSNLNYAFSYTASPVSFAVTRLLDGEVLVNITSLTFMDQFLSATTPLGVAPRVYGVGEHVDPLLLNTFNAHSYTLWNADVPTPPDQNIYGSHPFWLEIRGNSGHSHGVFLRNSNGMDVILNHDPVPYATWNVDGGVFDWYVFNGPDPQQVVAQYHAVIGTPHMPPYWALGWHQCKYGWPNLQTLKAVVANYSAAQIPLDTMWSDIDHMQNYEDFSFDPVNYPPAQMSAWVQNLHADGQHYVVIVDPGIHTRTGYAPYDNGLREGIFIMNSDGKTPFVGTVWPGQTSFPDWFNPNAQSYWSNAIASFLAEVPIDGLWIDMNEISNFGNGDDTQSDDARAANAVQFVAAAGAAPDFDPNNPPYAINNFNSHAALNTKTLAMDCLHYPYNATYYEYNTHNLFGLMEGIATKTALESISGKRSFVLSRSTFAGSGHHVAHWLGDNYASWDSMAVSIPGILNHNMYGIPLVGADICGFLNPTTEELCARWSALGAFYPFARNHHDIHSGDQEPYLWASVTRVARQTLGARYALLPYYYTLFYEANQRGGTVARPLFFEFPADSNTIPIDTQFLIGKGLLITPVLTQGATSVTGYFPPSSNWYEFWTGYALSGSGSVTLNAPMEYLPVHVRGGTIIPMQQPAMTTAASRQLPFELLVALSTNGTATGTAYYDDGESLQVGAQAVYATFSAASGLLTSDVLQSNPTANPPPLATITVWGVDQVNGGVTVNGAAYSSYSFDAAHGILVISGLNLQIGAAFSVEW